MAESDGNRPASGPLSSEEADRLSEKFRPSWEVEPEPPTVPKVEVPQPLRKQTLLGIAVPVISAPPAAATPSQAPDDLDWELPTNPVPSPLEASAPSEPVPESKPSGIGQTYKPKDTDAPAIVLTDEVKRGEELARAALEAEHRSRRAPTVLKFKAVEVAKPAVDDFDEAGLVPPKKGLGVWIGLAAGAVTVAIIGVALVLRGGPAEPVAPKEEPRSVAPTAAEPPIPLPPEPGAQPTVPPAPSPSPPTVEPEAALPTPAPEPKPEPAARPARTQPAGAAPRATPAPKPPKPTPAAAPKPATPKPGTASKPAAGVIVRDSPF